ncbi:hypothetical protein AXX17_AT5G27180 [Arabidopsis thaliana]|uniref:Stress regulated protein n=1 Tax=Arabidopsis thaliana TaxID=3702 RepID=A0A178UAB4_ARATH|nr:hypothetical protein AXX17_AT5G27180 [Arabidopsis thaliana]
MVMLLHSVGLIPCSNQQKSFLFHSYYRYRCIVCSSETGLSIRRQALEQVDSKLSSGDERAALSLVKDLQGKPDGLRCFGAARQVPQRLYTLEELKLNGINAASLLSPTDTTLGSIERNLQIAAVSGGIVAWKAFDLSSQQLFFLTLGFMFLWTLDLVSFNGGIGSLVLDTTGHTFSQRYHNRVVQKHYIIFHWTYCELRSQHEAGHFLVAYLVGILPRGYTLSSLEALQKEGSLNIQAGSAFVDYEFLEEVNSGKVSATMLNRFSCIALAGVATEYLLYGYAEGGLDDISKVSFLLPVKNSSDYVNMLYGFVVLMEQLDGLVKSLGFTQKKADSQVRWSVLNTILLLRRHEIARSKLAQAMSKGESVGSCIQIIEDSIDPSDI